MAVDAFEDDPFAVEFHDFVGRIQFKMAEAESLDRLLHRVPVSIGQGDDQGVQVRVFPAPGGDPR